MFANLSYIAHIQTYQHTYLFITCSLSSQNLLTHSQRTHFQPQIINFKRSCTIKYRHFAIELCRAPSIAVVLCINFILGAIKRYAGVGKLTFRFDSCSLSLCDF